MKSVISLLGVLVPALFSTPLQAGKVEILDPWVQEQPPSVQALAAYMLIRNTNGESKTVVGASSPFFAKIELHETLPQGNQGTMVSRDSLTIAAKGQVYLKPGGYHLMLIAPLVPQALQAGDKVPLLLFFSDGTSLLTTAYTRRVSPGSRNLPPPPSGLDTQRILFDPQRP